VRAEQFIDGRWVRGGGQPWPVINPATGTEMLVSTTASRGDVERAVEAASRALPLTRRSSTRDRAVLLRRIAAGLRGQASALARLETLDVGKPLRESEIDVADAARVFEYHAELLEGGALEDEHPGLDVVDYRMRIRRVPIGVVALVTAWNHPLLLAAWKLAPALACGCTAVLKPSEWATLSTLELAGLIHAAGAPAGAVNVVTGTGAAVGHPLVNHRAVRKVSFTGSGATGRAILAGSTGDLRRVSLELGGKSAAIVLDDADIDAAIDWTLMGIYLNQGQVCSATSRILVDQSLHQTFVSRFAARARNIQVGDGLDPATEMGPLISAAHRDRVLAAIDAGQGAGAALVAGGGVPAGLERGFFVAPTVFADVPHECALWRDEVFGPVVAINAFRSTDEARELANQSEFGLAAAVFGADAVRAEALGEQLEAGTVWINCAGPALPQGPWGGFKASGHGRELGRWGLEAYSELQQVTAATGASAAGWFSGC
jgi:betaine-aldehyde dehydrogenase